MLYTIAAVLILLWLLGLFTGVPFGGLVHVLLVAAAICILYSVLTGKRTL